MTRVNRAPGFVPHFSLGSFRPGRLSLVYTSHRNCLALACHYCYLLYSPFSLASSHFTNKNSILRFYSPIGFGSCIKPSHHLDTRWTHTKSLINHHLLHHFTPIHEHDDSSEHEDQSDMVRSRRCTHPSRIVVPHELKKHAPCFGLSFSRTLRRAIPRSPFPLHLPLP